jgi:transposase
MDLALVLDATEGIEVAVLNPKRIHDFARSPRRSKSDSADAVVLAEFSLRMDLVAWQRPSRSARQWVARSGLHPVHQDSGTSVHKPARISRAGSRHLRRALYLPAWAAVRWDPHRKAFYEVLLARHKRKMQARMAVARKLLHAIYGMFKTRTPYDGKRLFPALSPKLPTA